MERTPELFAADGYSLRYRTWDPAGAPRAQLVLLNGIMSNARWFSPLVPDLTRAGIRLVGADRRGSGDNQAGWGDAPSATTLVDDALRIIEAETRPDLPWMLVGWCWGAALAVAVAQKLGSRLAGLVLITPGFFPTQAVKDAIAAQSDRIATLAADEAGIESPILERYFTGGPALADFIERDERRLRVMTPRLLDISGKLVASAVARLPKLSVRSLLVLADHEDATDNAATLAFFERIPADRWHLVRFPTRHGVQFDAAPALAAAIVAWIETESPTCAS